MNLKVTIIQANLVWENVEENLNRFSEKIDSINEDTDLIVLPEMFATGFSMKPEKVASFEKLQLDWLSEHAVMKNAVITGSIIREAKGNFYNSLIWMKPDRTYEIYDKRHLFSFAGEDKHYTQGENQLITKLKDWRIKLLICYDLRFPVWSRNRKDYDVLIYVANWPDARIEAWKTLLFARAIENQAYVIAVNRVGDDGNGIAHSGDSLIIDPKGNVICDAIPYKEAIKTVTLNYEELISYRKKFPAGNDADDFRII